MTATVTDIDTVFVIAEFERYLGGTYMEDGEETLRPNQLFAVETEFTEEAGREAYRQATKRNPHHRIYLLQFAASSAEEAVEAAHALADEVWESEDYNETYFTDLFLVDEDGNYIEYADYVLEDSDADEAEWS